MPEHYFPTGVNGPVLCLDIGSGTQDVLLALPESNPENWPRLVLPSPARAISRRIGELSAQGQPIWLHGDNMGGGIGKAVSKHLAAGLALAAQPEAAHTLNDDLARVEAMGVTLAPERPDGYAPVRLADYEPGFWQCLLAAAGLPQPVLVLAAAQDHGYHPNASNRECRFQYWRAVLEHGDPARLISRKPDPMFTRLLSLQSAIGNGYVADTASAALLGALSAPEIAARAQRQGVLIVNVGNSHVAAFLLFQGRIFGVYEHHTGMHTTDSLLDDLREFRLGWLPDEQVRAKGGHGAAFSAAIPPEAEGFKPAYILGPQRELLAGHGQFIAPAGDMMLAGCFGLLHGLSL